MEYEDFCEQLKSGVLQNMEWNLTEKEYEFYPDGYTADGDKEKLEAAQKALNDVLMPIGAKMYQSASADAKTDGANADNDSSADDGEAVEGEVVDKE
jgi:hypothetical protein